MKSNGNITKRMLNDHKTWILSWGEKGKLADFNDWNLDNANLQLVDLSMAKFHYTSLKNANLSGIIFFKAEIYYTNLKGANISNGDLGYSHCEGSNFADANLEGANFEGANLRKTNFTGANLQGARFKGADLSFSQIVDANLENADFRGAKLKRAKFEGASIDETSFEKIYPINEKSPERNLKDNLISSPLLNETKSHKSGTKNQKSEKTTSNINSEIKSEKEQSLMDLNAIKPDIIEKSIGALIDKVKSNIQFGQIKALCKDQHGLEKIDKIDITQGDIVIYDGEVAFKFDCRISHNLSLLLDRKGKLINVNRSIEK
jgi:uncharacterized protein YjbI with pentapeptide repeats